MGIRDMFQKSAGGIYEFAKALSAELHDKVRNGEAHWVTVKEGPLEGRHLLIDGPKPTGDGQSRGRILAGHGIPKHVIEKISGATHAHQLKHETSELDRATGEPVGNHPYRTGDTVTYQRPGTSKKLMGKVEGVSGDTLKVNVKGATVHVSASHVVSHEGSKTEPEKPKRTKKNPFNHEPPGGWAEADRVPKNGQSKPPREEPEYSQSDEHFKHKIGDKIYYRGDQANHEGWFRVDGHRDGNYGRNIILKEINGERTMTIPEHMISEMDSGNGSTRFVSEEGHNQYREQKLRQMQRWSEETRRKNG